MRIFTLQELAFSNNSRREFRRLHPEDLIAWRRKVAELADAKYKAENRDRLNELSRERVKEWTARPGNQERKSELQRKRRAKISPARNRHDPSTEGLHRIEPKKVRSEPVCFVCGAEKPLLDGQRCCAECFASFKKVQLVVSNNVVRS